jgi:hypothetical protein
MNLLVLDYPGHRAEAKVAELCLEDAGHDVVYLLSRSLPTDHAAQAYARSALSAVGPRDTAPDAVLAYCMAAPLAQEVAAATGAPLLVLLDGEPSTPEAVERELRLVLRPTATGVGRLPAWWDRELLRERTADVLTLVRDSVRSSVRAGLADGAGLEGEELDEVAEPVVTAYVDWITHLVAACRADFPAWGGEVVHVASREHQVIDPWPGAAATSVVRLDVERNGLLADDSAREAVLRILRRWEDAR